MHRASSFSPGDLAALWLPMSLTTLLAVLMALRQEEASAHQRYSVINEMQKKQGTAETRWGNICGSCCSLACARMRSAHYTHYIHSTQECNPGPIFIFPSRITCQISRPSALRKATLYNLAHLGQCCCILYTRHNLANLRFRTAGNAKLFLQVAGPCSLDRFVLETSVNNITKPDATQVCVHSVTAQAYIPASRLTLDQGTRHL